MHSSASTMRRSGKAMTFSSTIFSAFRLPITVSRRVFSSSQPSPTTPATSSPPNTKHDSLLAYALDRVRQGGTPHGANLVAYSGGVDSSLVAALVKRAFPTNSLACIGLSASLPSAQLSLAREIAAYIDIPLKEVTTAEGDTPGYVANRGLSCFHCKTHLYTALQAVAAEAQNYREEVHHAKTNISLATETGANAQGGGNKPSFVVTLFNGTNADDRQDPTRVGLKAARNFRVRSPIDHLNKNEVRKLAQALGLPNWQHAASPCLRSRLALGVPAVEEHLRKVEAAEELVRATLGQGGREGGAAGLLGVHHNVRVRLLSEGKAVIEVDAELLESAASFFLAMEGRMKAELGFADVTLRAFKSGSVNGLGGTTRIRNKGHGGEEVEQEMERIVKANFRRFRNLGVAGASASNSGGSGSSREFATLSPSNTSSSSSSSGSSRRGSRNRSGGASSAASASPPPTLDEVIDDCMTLTRLMSEQLRLFECTSVTDSFGVRVIATATAAVDEQQRQEQQQQHHQSSSSTPQSPPHFFFYNIRVENRNRKATVQLVGRHWVIQDNEGKESDSVPKGSIGVVGHEPVLRPGQTIVYMSGAKLPTPYGSMQGSFQMVKKMGEGNSVPDKFDARVSPFVLK